MTEQDTRIKHETVGNSVNINPSRLLREIHLAKGMFTEAYDAGDIVAGFSHPSLKFFNTALLLEMPRQSLVDQTEHIFRSRGLKPTFYVPVMERYKNIHKYLIEHEYEYSFEDQWMYAKPDEIIPIPSGSIFKKVEDDEDIITYANILKRSHQMPVGPDNPYDEYSAVELELIKKNLKEMTSTSTGRGLIVFKEIDEGRAKRLEPVSVATVSIGGSYAYISNVGTLPSERHQGFGLTATASAVDYYRSLISQVDPVLYQDPLLSPDPIVCLATATNQGPSQLFNKMGFKKSFRAIGYVGSH